MESPRRSASHARHGMVAASHPLAVRIGVDLLRRGGSAVDAAIGANAALGFLEPTACGVGGDLFAMVWNAAEGRLHAVDGSGRAPRALTAERVQADDDGTIPLFSPFSWTVPGAVDAWFELHDAFGRLTMADVLAPAIACAEEGEPVPRVIATEWQAAATAFRDKPGFASTFLPGGEAPSEGQLFRNPRLAAAYRLLASDGRDAFYRGPIARALVAFSDEHGGFFQLEDLADHRSDRITPISTSYHDVEVFELPPAGQGLAALQILNVLETFELAAWGRESCDTWHVMVEAKKLAYEDRARFYADPAFAEVPLDELLSKEYARRRAAKIDRRRAANHYPPGTPRLATGDTTYLAVGDREGNLVSWIQSNYTGFGSGYVLDEWGFGLQDRGGLFSLDPSHANYLEPGKRPFHTIIPAMAFRDARPWMAFGVMGGDMQPQGHAQVLANLLDFGLDLQQAGDAPRFRHLGSSTPTGLRMTDGGALHLEPGVPETIRRGLTERGHRLGSRHVAFGGYQAVARDSRRGTWIGATESRKDGSAQGY